MLRVFVADEYVSVEKVLFLLFYNLGLKIWFKSQ